MKISIKAALGNMVFDMPEEKVVILMNLALQCAVMQHTETRQVAQVLKKPPKVKKCITPQSEEADPEKEQVEEGEKYKGMLSIKCEHCGEVGNFSAKTPIDTYVCEHCGKETVLKGLSKIKWLCECGNNWVYKTNRTNPIIEMRCIHCDTPVDLEYNPKHKEYRKME